MSFDSKIFNYPNEKEKVTYAWSYLDNLFTDEELNQMCTHFDIQGVTTGKTTNGEEKLDIRVSSVKFYEYDPVNLETIFIFQKINNAIEMLNNIYYGFNVYGYNLFQYTEYEKGGKYEFHTDTIFTKDKPTYSSTRKLSITICLNQQGIDYEGGNFEINDGTIQKVETPKGRLILFPSFMLHRITPITKGKRKSIVVWVEGPKFK